MFNQLGRLVWAPFTFLWTYVTLPALLALLTICFLNLYHKESLYYISWNNSMVRPCPRQPGDLAPHPVSLTLRDLETPNPKNIDSTPPSCISYPQDLGNPAPRIFRPSPHLYLLPWGPGDTAPRLSLSPCGPLSLSPEPGREAALPEDSPGLGHLPQCPGSAAHPCVPAATLVVPGGPSHL